MRPKLAGYSLLSVISFCFFTFLFHAVVNAQSPESPFLLAQTTEKANPTPTIYFFNQNTQTQQTIAATSQPPLSQKSPTSPLQPTPTIYQAQTSPTETQSEPTTTPLPTATPTLAPTSTPQPTPTLAQPTVAVVADLDTLFTKYSNEYGADKELLKRIARCESGFNTNSNNSGMYLGMFQFATQTWISNRSAMGVDTNPDLRTNAEEAIKTAAYMISKGRQSAWPNCH